MEFWDGEGNKSTLEKPERLTNLFYMPQSWEVSSEMMEET